MDRTLPLKAALVAALITPPLVNDPVAVSGLHAQDLDPLWMMGGQVVDFRTVAQSGPVLRNLPQCDDPLIDDAYEYQGQVAQFSQNVQVDEAGEVLFFAVDGRIYDRKGRLLADEADADCQVCLEKGSSEILFFPVPGSCLRFYVVTTRQFTGIQEMFIDFGVLDLTLPSDLIEYTTNNITVMGRFIGPSDDAYLDDFAFSSTDVGTPVEEVLNTMGTPESYYLHRIELPLDDEGYSDAIHMDVVRLQNSDLHVMVINSEDHLTKLLWTPTGPRYLGTEDVIAAGLLDKTRSAKGELEVQQVGSELVVAYSHALRFVDPVPDINIVAVGVWRFDLSGIENTVPTMPRIPDPSWPRLYQIDNYAVTYTPAPTDPYGTLVDIPRCGGLEFSPNGRYIYFQKSSTSNTSPSHLGYIDLDLGIGSAVQWLILNGQPGSLPTVDGELELNIAPDGNGWAVYAVLADGLGGHRLACLRDPDQPNAANWVDPVIGVAQPATRPFLDGVEYRLLNSRVRGDTHLEELRSPGCCGPLLIAKDDSRTIDAGTATWSPGDNPFCDTYAPILFNQELRLAAGAHITAQDLTFAFSADAALVLEPGASLTCTNCTFTSACEGEWWKGIRVEGTTSDGTQSQQYQGRLSLWSSEVRNAEVGVWCARELTPNAGDPDHYGGRVFTSNSTFRNNITGVRIERYHRVVNNDEEYNLCYFANTDFITDADWPDPGTHPLYHAWLQDVNGVTFSMCAFRNDDFQAHIPKERGWGLLAVDATFVCTGGSDHQQNKFENLALGILALVPDPALNYILDGMGFQNNAYYGLIDFQGRNPRITNNAFQTLGTDLLPGGTASCGLYLWSTEGYLVERNTFVGSTNAPSPTAGIWFRGPSTDDNEIYDNDFDGLTVASMAYGNHVGPSPIGTNTKPGLQWLCGDHGLATDNTFDQMVLPDLSLVGNIRAKQGDYALPEFTANNTYHSTRNCPGSTWDVYVEPLLNPADVDVQYFYLAHNNSPAMRPRCIHEPLPALTPLSFVDEYYDLVEVGSLLAFDPAIHCDEGSLDKIEDGNNDHVVQLNAYQLRLQELASAITQYHGEVDGGDKPDLLALIEQNDPWQPSYVLRDEMLLQTPLSDEVLVAAIWREQPMDPWHLTQVLIANSELSNAVWQALEESVVLAPFYLALLDEYEGDPSTRAPYEQEVALRHAQKSRLQHALLRYYAQDSSRTGNMTDSIDLVLTMDTSYSGRRLRYELACHRGDHFLALQLKDDLFGTEGADDLSLIGSLTLHYGTGWDTITGGDLADLEPLALDEGRHGGAVAWGRLLHLRQLDSLPPAIIPEQYRGPWRAKQRGMGADHLGLGAYPNPANERAIITLPKGVGPSVLTVYSPMGAVVDGLAVMDGQPFVELSTRHWTPGIHLCQLRAEGIVIGEVKLNIQH